MTLMPRRDYHAEAVRRFQSHSHYPNGSKSWAEFCASMQRDEDIYFALTLMSDPDYHYYGRSSHLDLSFLRSASELDETVFGVLTRRTDGKIGRLCFGEASIFEKKSNEKYALIDGLSKADLHLSPESEDEFAEYFNVNRARRVITGLYLDKKGVEAKLEKWLCYHVSGKEDPNKERALDLQSVRIIMRQFLPDRSMMSEGIRQTLEELDAKIETRVVRLRKLVKDLKVTIKGHEAEIATLQ